MSIDTLRRDHVNALGYAARVTTPTLDRLLAEGVALLDHRSCSSWTYPSMLCALTGQDQVSLGVWPPNHLPTTPPPAPDEVLLLAERMQATGRHTMLAAATAFLGQASNMDQGVDRGWGRFYDDEGAWIDAEDVLAAVDELMAARPPDAPFMLHVHLLDPHMPFNPPARFLTGLDAIEPTPYDLSTHAGTLALWRDFDELDEAARALNLAHLALRYDACLRYVDEQLALLLTRLDAAGVWDEAALMLYTDHGEEFWEHGNFNHGYTAFDEVTRALALFWQPGNLRPARVEGLTTHEDLVPTAAALLELPEDPAWTGAVVGATPRTHTFNLSWRGERTVQSVTDGQTKLVYRWDGQRAFYDLALDPGEQVDRYDVDDPRVIAAWERLLPEVERLAARETSTTPAQPGP